MLCGLDVAPFPYYIETFLWTSPFCDKESLPAVALRRRVAGGSLSQNSLLAISLFYAEIMAAHTYMDNHEVCCALDRFKLLIACIGTITAQTSVLVSESNEFRF